MAASSSPRMIRSSVSTSTSQSTITRRPFALTISIRLQPGPVPFSGCSGTIIAGTNPATSPSRPSRYALRQANSSWLEIPCRRAVADASRGPEKLSSTIRSFSASDHRRRRPVSTISRRLIWRVSVRSSIPTISYMPGNSARRPTPGGYSKAFFVKKSPLHHQADRSWREAWQISPSRLFSRSKPFSSNTLAELLDRLALPGRNLGRVQLVLGRQLRDRLVALDRLKRNLGFELSRKPSPRPHGGSSSASANPP